MAVSDAGLYIHIPFCAVKCRFCHFATFPGLRGEIPRYLRALSMELAGWKGMALDSVYVGGGTPTLLSEEEFRVLFATVRRVFHLEPGAEITVECEPAGTGREKLQDLRAFGVNRVSLGLQAGQDGLLKKMGRRHTAADFARAFRAAREAGFPNLNVDLIYGLPGQTLADWKETIDFALALGPEHLSAYALDVDERSALGCSGYRPDDDLQAEMYASASQRLESEGYRHYEISNFARAGYECRHNLRYWKNLPVLGAGVSAAGFYGGARWRNTERLSDYLERVETGLSPVAETERLEGRKRAEEDLILSLRLSDGARIDSEAEGFFGQVLSRFIAEDSLQKCGEDRIRMTRSGWLASNVLFRELLSAD